MKSISVWIIPLLLLVGCINRGIQRVKLCKSIESFPPPDSLKHFFTKKELIEFKKGEKLFWEDDKVHYNIYYILKDGKKTVDLEGYFYIDAQVGSCKGYHANGNLSEESNFVLYSSALNKTIQLEEFNKLSKEEKRVAGYNGIRHGTWNYYSEEGKLIKTEVYDKGKLVKTLDHQ